jgi:hypothetical protein
MEYFRWVIENYLKSAPLRDVEEALKFANSSSNSKTLEYIEDNQD